MILPSPQNALRAGDLQSMVLSLSWGRGIGVHLQLPAFGAPARTG